MKGETVAKRIEWVNNHKELQLVPSMHRRKFDHNYAGRCVYMFTICVLGRKPFFGTLCDADAVHPSPWVLPSELGCEATKCWDNISIENPQVENIAFQLMPDHVHGILFVREQLQRHVGHIISRFKAKVTKGFRSQFACSETQSRTIQLWEPGYNDRILSGKGQLATWIHYLQDNPRRLWVKRENPHYLTARQGIKVCGHELSALGNLFLLEYPYKVAVKCSRKMTQSDIEAACSHYLSLAQDGAVLVSPSISDGEKEVMKRAFTAGFPLIFLLENGISHMQKPCGRQFDACSEGRLLLLSPWEHHNDHRRITRAQCETLNQLAAFLCNSKITRK